nr:ParB/RepB/Spo0J family partition protein [uncultured Roseateles sp.]
MDQTTEQQRITEILLGDLHESPFNPRKTFNDTDLQELAEDIKSHGRILQPLLVRPRVPALFANTNDPAAVAGYELVFGHRRLRAARLAGLTHAPCMVHVMTDLEVKRAQISENLQRKDVHPIEEAEGFRALIDEHNETAERIAMSLGGMNKLSYVYSRLKLLQACSEVKTACLANEIGSETALLIARLRIPKLQEKALGYIKGKYLSLSDGGKESTRRISDLLNERFTLDLHKAPFPIDEEMLLPAAGNCIRCTKRTANAPEFTDVLNAKKPNRYSSLNLGADVCTDPDCFAEKKVVFFKRQADELRAKGREVVDGNKARVAVSATGEIKGAYLPLATVRGELDKAKTAAQLDGKIPMPAAVVIQDPRTGKTYEAVKVSDLVEAGVKVSDAKQREADSYEAAERRRKIKREANEAKAKELTRANLELIKRVRTHLASSARTAHDLQLVVRTAMDGIGHWDKAPLIELWNAPSFEALVKRVGSMAVGDLNMLLMDCVLVTDAQVQSHALGKKPETLLQVAKNYGIEAPQAPAKPVPTPSTAAQAQGKAAAKKAGSVQYRNAKTGETWSGRGLQPKWLKVAIAGGAKLSDFVQPTPSTAGAGAKQGASLRELVKDRDTLARQIGLIGFRDGDELAAQASQSQTVEAGFAGEEIAAVKQFITSHPDTLRAPYKKVKVDAGVPAGGGVAQPVANEEAGA